MDVREAVMQRTKADATLTTLVAARIFPEIVPQTATRPAIAITITGNDRGHNLQGADGVAYARVEFDVRATSRSSATAIKEAIENVWDGYAGTITSGANSVIVLRSKQEDETDRYERQQDAADAPDRVIRCDYFVKYRFAIPTF
jgi:hypothetical protein